MTVYFTFIRHGESEANEQGLYGTDMELNANGIAQAKTLVGKVDCDVIYASNLKRAIATAKHAFPGREIEIEPLFRELSFGDYEYKKIDRNAEPFVTYLEDVYSLQKVTNAKETLKGRVEAAMKRMGELAREHYREDHIANIVIVSHRTLLSGIMCEITGKTFRQVRDEEDIGNCECVQIEYDIDTDTFKKVKRL